MTTRPAPIATGAEVALVALGGGVGGVLRWGAGQLVAGPWTTCAVNALGCLLIGVLMAAGPRPKVRLLLGTGALGGFTTFSGYAVDVVRTTDLAHLLLTPLTGLAAAALGLALTRRLRGPAGGAP
ncbi:FluC/FEX family fluoride channel [Actinosynnema mirum]|uniref:Fluoride-specific ion channel FluC n=1 Tax=Actinosynnema mirum (strain ATCC 29888 / DSM 43827 / JCM 3225 / NBRC 14064 / NCIMB 13271 / NRRL B-12336 / IMRU 3971 / 101) TaxID=446462 RepID=C6W998_ACTMD|nr:CrcB family protein [Actinosynnema mirum]ACU35261.1 Camphor resistance CrcB protein [Actinosynnema mirum DSM 43827]AXX28634.1 Putative CrcB protein (Integral membrane protein involved in chromosome condensation) [Actinosynnema pretiosum subsp. pretiosum]